MCVQLILCLRLTSTTGKRGTLDHVRFVDLRARSHSTALRVLEYSHRMQRGVAVQQAVPVYLAGAVS